MNRRTRNARDKEGKLSDFESELIKDFLSKSIDQSALSMGQLLHIRVRGELLNFGQDDMMLLGGVDELGKFRAHVMKVKLNGDIGGAFYFIINWHEVELINRVCMPDNINPSTNSENRQMKMGIISEIENTIAAQSVSGIADFLGVSLLGGVPDINTMQGDVINEYLHEQYIENDGAFYVQSILKGVAVDIAPYYIWMLDRSFSKILKLNTVM